MLLLLSSSLTVFQTQILHHILQYKTQLWRDAPLQKALARYIISPNHTIPWPRYKQPHARMLDFPLTMLMIAFESEFAAQR